MSDIVDNLEFPTASCSTGASGTVPMDNPLCRLPLVLIRVKGREAA